MSAQPEDAGQISWMSTVNQPLIMSPEEFTQSSYDYVVVGGGTAGLVVAARLSEDPNVTVGVLEAGGNRLDDPLIDAPALFMQLWDKSEYDWSYKTVPQVCYYRYHLQIHANGPNRKVQRAVYMVGCAAKF